ncbi:MAG: hypothetical protein AAF824_19965, partial [Bacteroidota bacterium]
MASAQPLPSDYLSETADIRAEDQAGISDYDLKDQAYYLESPNSDEWGEHFVYKRVSGDFIFTANLAWRDTIGGSAFLGVMVRNTLKKDSSNTVSLLLNEKNHVGRGGLPKAIGEVPSFPRRYETLQVERDRDQIIFRIANKGEPLMEWYRAEKPEMNEEVLVGLVIINFRHLHSRQTKSKAKAWNVRIDQPVKKGYDAYEDGFLDSRLETINVFTGERKIIHEHGGKLEAPNWMPDGEKLLYNQDGHIYTISLDGGEPQQLDTGLADRNNNDHGISFDGKLLAISHHRENMPSGGSTVYVLPIEGGEPKLVTEQTPSYWHGWSPDNESVIYVAKREGDDRYNIFRKSIHGGEEEQLTDIAEGEHV